MIKYDLLHKTIFFSNKDLIDYAQQVSFHKIKRMTVINLNDSLPR